ncbi:MAG: undecaprenyldiphospho-muramoylpentapeptide beta-N-acetylglucosaminyltransferase [Desulfobacterales bacterium]|jgi:UDP-N-acetylglucosamine--N-acetylmuramyl-(pentapeptide) pyrophosphoryl-undecaprenol N-acetylglucosamine transferase
MDPTTIEAASPPLRAVLTGGGTGGHLFPGVAICRELERRFPGTAILFIGTGRPLERKVITAAGYRHAIITVKGFKGMGLLRKLVALSVVPVSVLRAAVVLWRFKPQVVIGVGGYAAGPVCLAAYLLRIPVCLQEQNFLPGITNRLLARLARRIYIAFDGRVESFPAEKVLLTGNPVRAEIRRLAATPPPVRTEAPFTVMIVGGSQGAHGINAAVAEMLACACDQNSIRFIHQTGEDDLERMRQSYRAANLEADVRAFFDDMHHQYLNADLVICRAGASTVAELTCIGKPVIFVPFPHAADNHQEFNARLLVEKGAGDIILESELSGVVLWDKICHYRRHPDELNRMAARARSLGQPEAVATIVTDMVDRVIRS